MISKIDAALSLTEDLLREIKEFKKFAMMKFLGINDGTDVPAQYAKGFPFCRAGLARLNDITAENGIADGADYDLSSQFADIDYMVRIIGPENIKRLRFHPGPAETHAANPGSDFLQCSVRGGDIIMVKSGDDAGASAVVPFSQDESLPGGGIIRIRPDNKLCELFYLINVLHFYYHTNVFNMIYENDALTSGAVSEIMVPLPSIEEQKKIAESMLHLSGGMAAHENYSEALIDLRCRVERDF